jgi:hypothetical protein
MKNATTCDIIKALGGVKHVASKICVDQQVIYNWMRPTRGITRLYWLDILELARRERATWITGEVLKKAKGSYTGKAAT